MEQEFTISENEYISANKLFTQPTRKHYVLYVIALLIFAAIIVFSPYFISRIAAIGAIIGGVVFHVAGRFFYCPWQARKQYRCYTAIQEPIKVKLTDNAVCFYSRQGDSKLDWSDIKKWRENEEHILLYQAPLVYHIIPKRVADSVELVKALEKHVGKSS